MPESIATDAARRNAHYWDELASDYQKGTRISVDDFHYGPLLPGDRELQLLPQSLSGLRCLELGCGAGQNSIVLSKAGAETVALDVSEKQLAFGRTLSKRAGSKVEFRRQGMEELSGDLGRFDLIHSAYGVPFASEPAAVVQAAANLLNPGGSLLISMGHPVYAGEWLELDEDERGIFLTDYFHPTPDVRSGSDEDASTTWARAYPVSLVVQWLLDAGLQLERLLEPAALPVHTFSKEELKDRVPYYSNAWAEQVHELQHFPIVMILKASRPKT